MCLSIPYSSHNTFIQQISTLKDAFPSPKIVTPTFKSEKRSPRKIERFKKLDPGL